MKINEVLTPRVKSSEGSYLQEICKVYVMPTPESVQHFQETSSSFMPSKTKYSTKRKAQSTFRSTISSFNNQSSSNTILPLNPSSIIHQSQLYSSAQISRRILNENRSVYTRMMSTMRYYEQTKLQEIRKDVIQTKQKLDFFRTKTRKVRTKSAGFLLDI